MINEQAMVVNRVCCFLKYGFTSLIGFMLGGGFSIGYGQVRPNVILIMTDDQGYGELSCHGNPVLKTPHMDELYHGSIRLIDYHVAPMCTPTRGQLMTGLDAARNGAVNVSSGRALLRSDLPTMGDFFTDAGYHTGIFGKWHLGDNYPYRPDDRGFHETLWFPSSHIGAVPDFWGNDYFDDVYIRNGRRESVNGYCTDVFFEGAMTWIEQVAKSDEPFFAYLPTNAPHSPFHAPKSDLEEMSAVIENSEFAELEPRLKGRLTAYLAMIRNIDWNVGRLMRFLEKSGLAENTIVIFTTDNGSTFGPDYYNAGMKGKKTQLWEGGHRVPFFIRWPDGGISGGKDIAGLTQAQDVLPTLIDLCGIAPPDSPKFDGISLKRILQGEIDVPSDRMFVINYSRMPFLFDYPSPVSTSIMRREESAVLWQRWRLLGTTELYHLEEDPMQETNVIDRYPHVAQKMIKHLDGWWEGVASTRNALQSIPLGNDNEEVMLTACEWVDVFVDQQLQILRGTRKNGYWNTEFLRSGTYEFELARWPKETGLALADSPEGGHALPIHSARLLVDGIYQRKEIKPGDETAKFTVKATQGKKVLHTWFYDDENKPICGAYYVYVRRIGP